MAALRAMLLLTALTAASAVWNRTNCAHVAEVWVAAGVRFSWAPSTYQYVSAGFVQERQLQQL